jgi:cytidylate kinase
LNILVAGLTGSGKTTHTLAVARNLRIERVSGSELRLNGFQQREEQSSRSLPERAYWLFSAEAAAADAARLAVDSPGDDVDQLLLAECRERHRAIFDVWFLPWLAHDNVFRIWLDAPIEVRAQRIHRQLAQEGTPGSPNNVIDAVLSKDLRARNYALLHYGIDIFVDRGPFQVICDTGTEIPTSIMVTILSKLCRATYENDVRPLPPATALVAKKFLTRCPEDLMSSLGLR